MSATGNPQDSPVEAYLDRLHVELSTIEPRQARHMMAEAEAHLRDAVADAMARGLDEPEAEAEAVRRFGDAAGVARAERRRPRLPVAVAVRALVSSGLLLGGLGAVAVGLSGAVAAAVEAAAGQQFLVDSGPGNSFDPGMCATWLAGDPHARSCHLAAIADWSAETVVYRLALGALGLLALAGFAILRRRWRRTGRWAILPATVLDASAAATFAVAGAAVVLSGLNAAIAAHGHGVGQWLSAAIVAVPAAAVAGVRLLRDLQAPSDLPLIGP
jgi:hypothetical protein